MLIINANKNYCKGFSLAEAMLSALITSIGFVGVVALISASEKFTSRSITKQKMLLVTDQILEVMEADLANLDNYEMDLTQCSTAPSPSSELWEIKQFEWCAVLEEAIGDAGTENTRSITVTDQGADSRVVEIYLEGYDGEVFTVIKRSFDI
jgi:Tfp pilus assembly protein PilV